MLKSMTGFAHKQLKVKGLGEFTVHVRSYNNRFLDINIKTSRGMEILEKIIYETVGSIVNRGRIDIYVGFSPDESQTALEGSVLKKAKRKLEAMNNELKLDTNINLNMVMHYAEKNQSSSSNVVNKKLIEAAELVVCRALKELLAYKKKQGVSIKKNLTQILNRLTKMNKSFEAFVKASVKDIESVSKDVFEEFSLISFYIDQLRDMLKSKEERIGKKLDFLSQELLREVNTLQAKIKDKKISLQALYFKEEIERIREISNNIE